MLTLVTNLQHRLDNKRQNRLPNISLPWLLTFNTDWIMNDRTAYQTYVYLGY